jgi:hypothetical protein
MGMGGLLGAAALRQAHLASGVVESQPANKQSV